MGRAESMSRVDELQGAWCPLISPTAIAAQLAKGRMQITCIGLEVRCPKCQEFWPADTEFFFPTGGVKRPGCLHSYCKACFQGWKRARKAAPITTQPRAQLAVAAVHV